MAEAGNNFYRNPIWLDKKPKPKLGQKKIKEIGMKVDVATMRVIEWNWFSNPEGDKIYLGFLAINNQSVDDKKLDGSKDHWQYSLFQFFPKQEFSTYYRDALDDIMNDIDQFTEGKAEQVPGTTYLSFIINPVLIQYSTISPFYSNINEPRIEEVPQDWDAKISLYPTEQAQIVRDIEDMVTKMYNNWGPPQNSKNPREPRDPRLPEEVA